MAQVGLPLILFGFLVPQLIVVMDGKFQGEFLSEVHDHVWLELLTF